MVSATQLAHHKHKVKNCLMSDPRSAKDWEGAVGGLIRGGEANSKSSGGSPLRGVLSLPDDLLCHIFQFLHFIDLISCHTICSYLYHYLSSHFVLYHRLIYQIYFPNYQPFQFLSSGYRLTPKEEKVILLKWFKKEFKWTKIGTLNKEHGRYLHRSVPVIFPSAGASGGGARGGGAGGTGTGCDTVLIFGGATEEGYGTCGLLSVSLDENCQLIFQSIPYQDPATSILSIDDSIHLNINPLSPPNNSAYAMAADQYSNVYLYGGRILRMNHHQLESDFTNELWRFHYPTNQWTNINAYLDPHGLPSGCWGHTIVIYQSILFLFGGSCIGQTFNDLWMIDVCYISEEIERVAQPSKQIINHWKCIPLPAEDRPLPRGGHGAVLMGSEMFVFGGNNLTQTFSDFWKIDLEPIVEYYRADATVSSSSPIAADALPSSIMWKEITSEAPNGAPSARIGHTMTAIGSHYFVLYGGRNYLGGTMAHGVFLYHAPTNQWSDITPGDYHSEIADRTGHCCLPTSHGLIYFGGLTGTQSVTSDVIFLDLFSRFELRYNSHKDQYEYIDPAVSPPTHVYQQITRSLSQYFHLEGGYQTYCPIRIVSYL